MYEYNQELYKAWKHGKDGGSIFTAPVNGSFTAWAFSDGAATRAAESNPRPSTPYSAPTHATVSSGYSGHRSRGNYAGGSTVSSIPDGVSGLIGLAVIVGVLGGIFGHGDNKTTQAEASTHVYTAFEQGVSDRHAWESWFTGLSGEYRAGADFWATVRNNPYHGSCFSGPGQTSRASRLGCVNAKQFFDNRRVDLRRVSNADYWRGWNNI
jgi:hypothetical protein